LIDSFNGLFFQDDLGKPAGELFWILMKQEMTAWQWHQLDHIQIICTSLQTDNHTTSPLPHHSVFLQAGCPSYRPTNSVKAQGIV